MGLCADPVGSRIFCMRMTNAPVFFKGCSTTDGFGMRNGDGTAASGVSFYCGGTFPPRTPPPPSSPPIPPALPPAAPPLPPAGPAAHAECSPGQFVNSIPVDACDAIRAQLGWPFLTSADTIGLCGGDPVGDRVVCLANLAGTTFFRGCGSTDPFGLLNVDGTCPSSVRCYCSGAFPPRTPPPPSPSYPPIPPLTPIECTSVVGRTNALASATPKYCFNLNVGVPGGCSSYFTQAANKKVRLCYNPIEPAIAPNVKCAASAEFALCELPPPMPPTSPPAPPAVRRQLL